MSAPHSNSAYVPNYMMKQSLWNMGRQITQMKGLIKPDTQLMAWQPFLIAQAQRDVQNVYNSLAYNREVHGGHSYGGYGGYGGCGHCGKPTCGNKGGQYGGCGTFLRIAVTDPTKKACILEKKVAFHKKCCNPGCWYNKKDNQCRKLLEVQAELDLLLMQQYGPTTIETATDTEMEKLRVSEVIEDKKHAKEKAKLNKTLIMAGGVGLFGILALAILR